MRRAKIVCTLGPAVESIEKITELIDAGMNMARLNLSHGGHDEHQKRLDLVRTAAKKANKAVAILVDLQGPKIRLGRFSSGPHELSRGDTFTITIDDIAGTKDRVGTTYKGLPGDCKAGDIIMIDDGKVSVQVVAVKGNDVITKAISKRSVPQAFSNVGKKKAVSTAPILPLAAANPVSRSVFTVKGVSCTASSARGAAAAAAGTPAAGTNGRPAAALVWTPRATKLAQEAGLDPARLIQGGG